MCKKILNAITTIVLIVMLLLISLFYAPKIFGITPYVVTSGSMEPQFPVGALLYVIPTAPEKVQIGDAITFVLSGETIATHQVWDIDAEKEQFFTQGINNLDDNGNIQHDVSPVSFDALIGIPKHTIPYLGYLNRLFTTYPGNLMLPLFAGMLVLCNLLASHLEKQQADTQES